MAREGKDIHTFIDRRQEKRIVVSRYTDIDIAPIFFCRGRIAKLFRQDHWWRIPAGEEEVPYFSLWLSLPDAGEAAAAPAVKS